MKKLILLLFILLLAAITCSQAQTSKADSLANSAKQKTEDFVSNLQLRVTSTLGFPTAASTLDLRYKERYGLEHNGFMDLRVTELNYDFRNDNSRLTAGLGWNWAGNFPAVSLGYESLGFEMKRLWKKIDGAHIRAKLIGTMGEKVLDERPLHVAGLVQLPTRLDWPWFNKFLGENSSKRIVPSLMLAYQDGFRVGGSIGFEVEFGGRKVAKGLETELNTEMKAPGLSNFLEEEEDWREILVKAMPRLEEMVLADTTKTLFLYEFDTVTYLEGYYAWSLSHIEGTWVLQAQEDEGSLVLKRGSLQYELQINTAEKMSQEDLAQKVMTTEVISGPANEVWFKFE